jgi:hypothetical protein
VVNVEKEQVKPKEKSITANNELKFQSIFNNGSKTGHRILTNSAILPFRIEE